MSVAWEARVLPFIYNRNSIFRQSVTTGDYKQSSQTGNDSGTSVDVDWGVRVSQQLSFEISAIRLRRNNKKPAVAGSVLALLN